MLFSPYLLQSLIWIPTRILLLLFGNFRIEGAHNMKHLDRSKGVILMSNHTSIIDPILLAAALPLRSGLRPLFYVSLSPEHYTHLKMRYIAGGLIFRLWGAYPAYRGAATYEEIFKEHIRLLRHGKTVSIFPEGGITKTGSLGEAKPGVARLAEITGAVIVPIHIHGAWKMTWREFFLRRRHITLTVGQPLQPSIYSHAELFQNVAHLSHGI